MKCVYSHRLDVWQCFNTVRNDYKLNSLNLVNVKDLTKNYPTSRGLFDLPRSVGKRKRKRSLPLPDWSRKIKETSARRVRKNQRSRKCNLGSLEHGSVLKIYWPKYICRSLIFQTLDFPNSPIFHNNFLFPVQKFRHKTILLLINWRYFQSVFQGSTPLH